MALKSYSVLKGRPVGFRLGTGSSPHYQVHVVVGDEDYRIAVNVQSGDGSEVEYLVRSPLRPSDHRSASRARAGTAQAAAGPRRPGARLYPRQPPPAAGDDAASLQCPGPGQRPQREARSLRAARARGRGGGDLRLRRALGAGAQGARQVFRLQARARHPRHPHEPGQPGAAEGQAGRPGQRSLAGRRPFVPLPHAGTMGRESSSSSSRRPGTRTTRPATRWNPVRNRRRPTTSRRTTCRQRTSRTDSCGSSRRSSTTRARPSARP